MEENSGKINDIFGNRLRVRVCGINIEEDRVLLVRHKGVGPGGEFWSPPGGGMEFGTSAETNLKREFYEETGYEINIKRFICVHEYLGPPLHAIELFFEVSPKGGILKSGSDPEMDPDDQIISEVVYKDFNWIAANKGERLHHLLNIAEKPEDLIKFEGYFYEGKIN